MKIKMFCFSAALIFIVSYSYCQTEEDNIEYLRVQNQIKDGNYRKAINILSNISESGKASTFYLSYNAECYEKLRIYDTAAFFYKKLYDKTKDFQSMQKVAEMKDKQDAKQSCPNCHGIGYYYGSRSCSNCNGSGNIYSKCDKDYFDYAGRPTDKSCKGSGECAWCGGDGVRTCYTTSVTGPGDPYDCDCSCTRRNREKGKCMLCGGTGKLASACSKCSGNGSLQALITCSH